MFSTSYFLIGTCNLETGKCGAPTPIEGCENGAHLERWEGIGGTNVNALTKNYRYPFSPDATEILPYLQTPSYLGSNYGQRLQTFITPPVTCDWNFYIASTHDSELYLSSDDDPANKSLIASLSGWVYPKEWKRFTSQKGTVSLVKGGRYYLEAIHKTSTGWDNFAIGWECADSIFPLNVIGGEYTEVYYPTCTSDSQCNEVVTNPCEAAGKFFLLFYVVFVNMILGSS